MKYGERLRWAREQKQWSQSDLSARSGVSQASISKIERGDQDASTYTPTLAKALNVDVYWLATGEGEPFATIFNVSPSVDSWLKERTTQAFEVVIDNDCMKNYSGDLSIPDGATVIVEPGIPATNKSFVYVKPSATENAIFRQLIIDGDRKYLKALNPQYPAITLNEGHVIIGVVKTAILKL